MGAVLGRGVAAEDLEDIEHNLEGFTMNIHNITVDELPRRYRCHIVCVSPSIGRLLRRVAHTIICYSENHP
jgi:hypothetical protein